MNDNILYISNRQELETVNQQTTFDVKDMSWITIQPPIQLSTVGGSGVRLIVQVRHGPGSADAVVYRIDKDTLRVRLDTPDHVRFIIYTIISCFI